MSLIACGINHRTAPLALREQFTVAPEKIRQTLRDLVSLPEVYEAAVLSTCHRTEFYCHVQQMHDVVGWLKRYHQQDIEHCLYLHQEQEAVRHMMRVASGLDSLVLGEPQILGQMKSAFINARQAGTLGKQLHRLFQYVFVVTKQVRTDTAIGISPVSIAYAAVALSRKIFTDLSAATVLLIGAGETVELAARHFYDQGVRRFMFANRTLSRAQRLAAKWQGTALSLQEIPLYLHAADIVLSATSSALPILGKGLVETALKAQKRRPMLMLDIAVPRDIEPEVATLADVYLYTVDDLQGIVAENLKGRQDAAIQAEKIIDFQAAHYMRNLRSLDSVPTICAFRERVETIRNEELSKARRQLQRGVSPDDVLAQMARSLANKFMHGPSIFLRQAAYNEERDVLLLARQLFDLKD